MLVLKQLKKRGRIFNDFKIKMNGSKERILQKKIK